MLVHCPACQQAIDCSGNKGGEGVSCPRCQQPFFVPVQPPPVGVQAQTVIAINPRATKRQRGIHPLIFVLLMLGSVPLVMCVGLLGLRAMLAPTGDAVEAPPVAAKPAETAQVDLPPEDELLMPIVSQTYARNFVKDPSSVQFEGPTKFSKEGENLRVGGKMRAAHGSDAPELHTYYLELAPAGDTWVPLHGVLDGNVVWRNPDLKPKLPRSRQEALQRARELDKVKE